jgi:hypothetical protein
MYKIVVELGEKEFGIEGNYKVNSKDRYLHQKNEQEGIRYAM